jgi:transposase
VRAFLKADTRRDNCPKDDPTVVAVPWARHAAGHTRAVDDTVVWLAVHTSKSAVVELFRIAWAIVGAIATRVNADVDAVVDRFAGLRRIGIDEISYKRSHKYLLVVIDHDRG